MVLQTLVSANTHLSLSKRFVEISLAYYIGNFLHSLIELRVDCFHGLQRPKIFDVQLFGRIKQRLTLTICCLSLGTTKSSSTSRATCFFLVALDMPEGSPFTIDSDLRKRTYKYAHFTFNHLAKGWGKLQSCSLVVSRSSKRHVGKRNRRSRDPLV